jgi:hypothetical protein
MSGNQPSSFASPPDGQPFNLGKAFSYIRMRQRTFERRDPAILSRSIDTTGSDLNDDGCETASKRLSILLPHSEGLKDRPSGVISFHRSFVTVTRGHWCGAEARCDL